MTLDELMEDERNFLENYRELDGLDQLHVRQRIDELVDQQRQEKKKQFDIRKGGETMTNDYNRMCLDCQHFRGVCSGTRSPLWTGCILKDQDLGTARNYIDHMDELRKGAKK